MTITRKLIWAFWIFIIGMLIWEFYDYNHHMTQEAIDHPKQEHFFFFHTNTAGAPGAPAKPKHEGAAVEQVAFTSKANTPGQGSFTCYVTLKNVGNSRATNVQVHVLPFKGIMIGDEDETIPKPLPATDYRAQMGQWVTFPDLAPGESQTESASFLDQGVLKPGTNPSPEIIFESAKSKQRPVLPGAGG